MRQVQSSVSAKSSLNRNSLDWIVILASLIFLILTNRYTDLQSQYEFIRDGAGDSLSYLAIAESAPGLPTAQLHFHHVQRWVVPYGIGLVHQAVLAPLGASLYESFRAFAVLFSFLALLFLSQSAKVIGIPPRLRCFLIIAVAMNPYVIRYAFALPAMICDIAFTASLSAFFYFWLARKNTGWALSLALAAASRQTAVLLVPALWLWSWTQFQQKDRKFFARLLLIGLIPVSIYLIGSEVASGRSTRSVNLSTMIGLGEWLSNSFQPKLLIEFLIRALLPLLAPVALGLIAFYRNKKLRPPFSLFLLAAVCICSQPILGGPGVTGQSVARLDALALIPLWLAVGGMLVKSSLFGFEQESGQSPAAWKATDGIWILLMALGSFHHIYAWGGAWDSAGALRFAVQSAICAVGLSLWLLKGDRKVMSPSA